MRFLLESDFLNQGAIISNNILGEGGAMSLPGNEKNAIIFGSMTKYITLGICYWLRHDTVI